MRKIKITISNWLNKLFEKEQVEVKLEESIDESTFSTKDILPNGASPITRNRWVVQFDGIPPYYFSSYNYMGTDIHTQKRLLSSAKIISEDYSVFKIVLCEPEGDFDICEKLQELESKPHIGDVKILILGPTGLVIKKIVIPDCQVSEIKVFRELDYAQDGILYGEIVVKHKQRKLI